MCLLLVVEPSYTAAMPVPRLLFVCLGNICRSPTAEGIARAKAAAVGLTVEVDSAGTSDWHIGAPPDTRMQAAAAAAGYDLSPLRARQFTPADFAGFNVIYAMDRKNLAAIESQRPAGAETPVRLFRSADPKGGTDVPDPYYEGGFDGVVDLIERTLDRILADLR
ncbi:MAG: low molecular weight protein-tyrosine-phosphatase [Pseudomonadota bacterium]